MDHLLKIALLGTGKQPASAELTDYPADQLAGQCPSDSEERSLLLRAGAWTTCQLAGFASEKLTNHIEPAAPEDRPPCSRRAGEILVELLKRKQHDLLSEAFQLIVQFSQRIPPAILPQVLESCDPKEFEFLLPALGNRGRWLCRFNDTWGKSLGQVTTNSISDGKEHTLPGEIERTWNEGSSSERKAALATVRKLDPDHGRQWLEAVWSQEKADTRAELLEVLAVGIGTGDIAFLEQALADTSKRVRAVASQFLCHFEDSGIAKRMRALAESLLAYAPAGTQGRLKSFVRSLTGAKADSGKLSVMLPEEFDKQWEKDGIQEKPSAGTGKREFWLVQAMERVPPNHWEDHFRTSPASLIDAAQDDDFGIALLEAWSKAALDFQCPQWVTALWDLWKQWKPKKEQAKDLERSLKWIKELLQSMPEAESEPRALSLLERSIQERDLAFCHIAEILSQPWNGTLAHEYLSHLKRMASSASKSQESNGWINTLAIAARAIPQQCFAEALWTWSLPEGEEYHIRIWRKAVEEFSEIVQLRSEFYEVVASKK